MTPALNVYKTPMKRTAPKLLNLLSPDSVDGLLTQRTPGRRISLTLGVSRVGGRCQDLTQQSFWGSHRAQSLGKASATQGQMEIAASKPKKRCTSSFATLKKCFVLAKMPSNHGCLLPPRVLGHWASSKGHPSHLLEKGPQLSDVSMSAMSAKPGESIEV